MPSGPGLMYGAGDGNRLAPLPVARQIRRLGRYRVRRGRRMLRRARQHGGWHASGALRPWALPLLVAAPLALAARRAWPLAAYAAALAFTAAYLVTGNPPGPIMLAPFAALLTLIAMRPARFWAPAAAAGALLLTAAHGLGHGWLAGAVFAGMWLGLAGVFGAGLQARRRFLAEVRERAHWAAESRQEQARRRAAEERLRIAREVHDVVGHSLAVVSLQAGVAEHLLQTRPEEARQAIAAIRQVSRRALGELRLELAMLRGEAGQARAPAPGLRDLVDLVDSMRGAGIEVRLEFDAGEVGEVPEIVATAAFRIVQEALTNVARHAGVAAAATVRLATREGRLEVEVCDDGSGRPQGAQDGNGLLGMRERAEALGGTLTAGNRAGGGFGVAASLPVARP